jgi:hypothetical protein
MDCGLGAGTASRRLKKTIRPYGTTSHLSDRERGAVLAEGVAALWMITIGVVCGVTLLINCGMSTYYKEKMGFIANQAATYASCLPGGSDVREKTVAVVKGLLTDMKMPTNDYSVKVAATAIDGHPAVSVEIRINNLPLFGNGDYLPLKIGLVEKATALGKGAGAAEAFLWSPKPRLSPYIIPMYVMPPNGVRGVDVPVISP